MDPPSGPMTQQLIKRTRGRMSDEQKMESHLLRKAAKLHKEASRGRAERASKKSGLEDWTTAEVPQDQTCEKSQATSGQRQPPALPASELLALTASPFSSLSAPELPPAGKRRGTRAQGLRDLKDSAEQRGGRVGDGLAASKHELSHDAELVHPTDTSGDQLPLPTEASMRSISEDVDGPLAGSLSNLSIGWLEKEAAALQEAAPCEPYVEPVSQCPSLFTALLDVIQENNKDTVPLLSTPSLAFLSALSGSTLQEDVAEASASLDPVPPLPSAPCPAWESRSSITAAAPASESAEAASAPDVGPAPRAGERLAPTALTGFPTRVRVLHSRCNSDLSAFTLSGGTPVAAANASDAVPTNIITPVEMPLRLNLPPAPPAVPEPACGTGAAIRSQCDSSLAWYITPEGVLTPVLPAPGAAWKGRSGPIPGVVYSALGRRRGRPRKKPGPGSQPPAPAPAPSEPATPAAPPAALPPAVPPAGPLHPALALGQHPCRSVSLPKEAQWSAPKPAESFRSISLPAHGGQADVLGLLATLTGRSSLMQSAFLDGQYIGPLASAFLPGGAQYSELLLSSYLQSHDSSIEGGRGSDVNEEATK